MTLHKTIRHLSVELQRLREILDALLITVMEDRPRQSDVVLVDMIGDTTLELNGLLEEAIAAALDGQQAVAGNPDFDRVRRAMATCHERFNSLSNRFASDLVRYERVAELAQVGRRGGEWRAWSGSVKQALEACRQPLFDVAETLIRCWEEIAERAAGGSVSVQATSVGQALSAPAGMRTARQEIA